MKKIFLFMENYYHAFEAEAETDVKELVSWLKALGHKSETILVKVGGTLLNADGLVKQLAISDLAKLVDAEHALVRDAQGVFHLVTSMQVDKDHVKIIPPSEAPHIVTDAAPEVKSENQTSPAAEAPKENAAPAAEENDLTPAPVEKPVSPDGEVNDQAAPEGENTEK